MSTAEVLDDLQEPEHQKPKLTLVEAIAETAPEPRIIRESLLPLVEIAEVDEIENIFERLADLDTGSDMSRFLDERGIYLFPLRSSKGVVQDGAGIHITRPTLENDTRVYVHWGKDGHFKRLRMHRWVGGDSGPYLQTFHSTSRSPAGTPQELLDTTLLLEREVAEADAKAMDL